MEAQHLDKECYALFGSLNALSHTAVTGLEAELAPWSCPLHLSTEDPLLSFVDPNGADAGFDQPASALIYIPPRSYSTDCCLGDDESSVPADQLSLMPLSPLKWVGDDPLVGNAECISSQTSSAEEYGAFHMPLSPAQSLHSIECMDDAFWDLPWDEAAKQLSRAADTLCTGTRSSPSCSVEMDSCQTISAVKQGAAVKQPCLIQRAGSADTEASCASAAVQPIISHLPYQPCLRKASAPSLAKATAKAAPAPAALSEEGLPLLAGAQPAPDQALAWPDSAAITPALQFAAAGLVPSQACTRSAVAPAVAGLPSRAAAHPVPCKELALPANTPGTAAELGAAARAPTGAALPLLATRSGPAARTDVGLQAGRPRALAKVLKFRQQQQAYSQRKKVREAAVHAHVNDLKEKLAALQCNVGVLLGRHEELTRERPWHQQHEEIMFVAGLASLIPAPAVCHNSSAKSAVASDLLQKLMLEPTAMVAELCKMCTNALPDAIESQGTCESWPTVQAASECPSLPGSANVAWSSVLACLRLSRAQKDRIVVLYEEYVQEGAAAHQTCIDIASMVQVLPSIKGELADCMWPNMAACLVSSQLSSQAVRTVEMDSALTMACQKVLSPMQQRNLQILAPEALKDLRALCREVSAVCKAPRKAPPSSPAKPAQRNADAAQRAVHVPQSTQIMTCHNTSAKGGSAGFGVESTTSPLATITHNVAAPAVEGNTALPAVGDDIISDVASMPFLAQLPTNNTRDTGLPAAPPGNCSVAPADVPHVSDDLITDIWPMPASLNEVRPPAAGEAAAQNPAAAVVPTCNVELEDAALMVVAAQLAAVPSEAAFKSIIAAAQHKRRAALSPGTPKEPFESIGRALAMHEEAYHQAPPHKENRKKARTMSSP